MIADFAIHLPDKEIQNPHFHILCPIRPLKENGKWGYKQHRVYHLDDNGNLKQFVETYNYIMENRLFTVEALEERVADLNGQVSVLKAELDASDKRRKELKDLLQQAENYARLKPIFDEMNGIRWKGQREKYRQEQERELRQFYMARRKLKDAFTPDGKLSISAWRQEMEMLAREHEAAYARYKPLRDDLTKLLQVRHHVNVALEQRGQPVIAQQKKVEKGER